MDYSLYVGGYYPVYILDSFVNDGCWTWFTDQRAVYYNGATYIGWVNSSGSTGISKYNHATKTKTSFTLHTSLEVDDHDNVAILIRSDGRILALYCKHNDTTGIRYRISTNPEDISTWSTEVIISSGITTPVSYSNVFYLSSNNKIYNFFRSGAGGVGTNPWGMLESVDGGSTWSTSQTNFLTNTNARPYPKWTSNGIDRFDVISTNDHPAEGTTSIYHFYGKLENDTFVYYKSDGTLIGASVTPSDMTLIYDGSSQEAWVWDIQYWLDGNPCVLFVKYVSTTDQRFMFSRWTGYEWTIPVEITNGGQYLYTTEAYYSGGLCFDKQDPRKIYLSKQVGSYWEIQEWITIDNGISWTKKQDITSNSTVKNCRPVSPKDHNEELPLLFWSGTYTSFTNYNTSIKGIYK